MNDDGTIVEADLDFEDGELQFYQSGKIRSYKLSNGHVAIFDEDGRVSSIQDESDASLYTYAYHFEGTTLTQTSILNHVSNVTTVYDNQDQITSVTDHNKDILIEFVNGKIHKATLASGDVINYVPDPNDPDKYIADYEYTEATNTDVDIDPPSFEEINLGISAQDTSDRDSGWVDLGDNAVGTKDSDTSITYDIDLEQEGDIRIDFQTLFL